MVPPLLKPSSHEAPTGLTFVDVSRLVMGDDVLAKETYLNADGRELILYRHVGDGHAMADDATHGRG